MNKDFDKKLKVFLLNIEIIFSKIKHGKPRRYRQKNLVHPVQRRQIGRLLQY